MIGLQERWERPALLVVDMQNDFVRTGAPLEVPDARATIAVQKTLIDDFRSRELPIFFTRFLSHTYPNLLWNWSPECQPDTKCCWKGHLRTYEDAADPLDCSDIIQEIYPEPGDVIIEKYGYGAFHGTPLNDILRSLGVNSLVITGTVTQICVEETAREAFHFGFMTTVVEDAVSSFDAELHAATLKNFAMKFGWLATGDEVVRAIAR